MKLRSQRTHYMGASNRPKQITFIKNKDLHETSYAKSQSCYYKTASSVMSEPKKQTQPQPYLGTHIEFETARFDKSNVKKYKQHKLKLESIVPNLDFSSRLNEKVKSIREEFEGKDVNMYKLNQLKHTFIKNNQNRRNLQAYFLKFANSDNKIGNEQMKNIVREYGYDINDDEANMMFKLNSHGKKDHLQIGDFVQLMTKDNVYFRTLKLQSKNKKQTQQNPINFSQKVHLILKNKFPSLKQAFKIYRLRQDKIGQQQFNYVMKKLDLTDLVLTKKERKQIFEKFLNKQRQFNVQALLGSIASQQNAIKIQNKNNNFDDNIKFNEEIQSKLQQKSIQYKFKIMSNLQYQNQLQKALQVINKLRKINQKKDIIKNICKHKIHKNLLRQNVQKILQNQGVNFNKQYYDCFNSYIDYNDQGEITEEYLKLFLIHQQPKQAMDRFQRRVRVPPPNLEEHSEGYNVQAAGESLNKIKAVKINPEMKQLFANFDKDKDGYVSKKQFKKQVEKMQILQPWEVENLANYFDSESKGYMTFKDFTQKYTQQSIKTANSKEFQTQLKLKSHSDWLSTKRSLIKDTNQYQYNVPTKFSAWPDRLNMHDLTLVQPPQRSGQFIDESKRFNTNEKNNYAQEQKQAQSVVYENRLRKLAAWNQINQQRVAEKARQAEAREQGKNYSMRLAKQCYQTRCHEN